MRRAFLLFFLSLRALLHVFHTEKPSHIKGTEKGMLFNCEKHTFFSALYLSGISPYGCWLFSCPVSKYSDNKHGANGSKQGEKRDLSKAGLNLFCTGKQRSVCRHETFALKDTESSDIIKPTNRRFRRSYES